MGNLLGLIKGKLMENEDEAVGTGPPERVPRDVEAQDIGSPDSPRMQEILDENIGALLEMMSDLKTDIKDEWRRVKQGEVNEKELSRKIKVELPALVALTMQQESKLHDHSKQRAGKAGEYALDLGEARASIGERLARLRAAATTEGVSG